MQPYYQDASVTIYHGDCREVLPTLAPIDLVLTDPPYNAINRATGGLRVIDKGEADSAPIDIPSLAKAFMGLAPSVYVWCSSEQYSQWFSALLENGGTPRAAVWHKSNPSPMNGEHLWLSAVELCAFARRKGATFNEHCKHAVWEGPIARKNGHPTPKPLWLMQRIVAASSPYGGSVLDVFAGSGTTLCAAKSYGRTAVGVEMNEAYCEIAAKRVQDTGHSSASEAA